MNKVAQALKAEAARKETADAFLRIEAKVDELTDQVAELAELVGKLLPVEQELTVLDPAVEAPPAASKRAKSK